MSKKPAYGASYNCQYFIPGSPFGGGAIGGGYEGDTTLDYVGDSLEDVCENAADDSYAYSTTLPDYLVGAHTNLGGEIVAVIGEDLGGEDQYIVAVVFKDPNALIV